jgi:hypothetical protein
MSHSRLSGGHPILHHGRAGLPKQDMPAGVAKAGPALPRPAVQVAEGAAQVYPRLAPTCEWDTAAAHAIVLEAGGEVLQAGRSDSKGVLLEDWQVCVGWWWWCLCRGGVYVLYGDWLG